MSHHPVPVVPERRDHEVRCRACRGRTANITGYCPNHPERRAEHARRWAEQADISVARRAELVAGCLEVN